MAATGRENPYDFPAPMDRPVGLLTQVATRVPGLGTVGGVDRKAFGLRFIPWGCDPLRRGPTEFCGPEDFDQKLTASDDTHFDTTKDSALRELPTQQVQGAFKLVDGLTCSTLSVNGAQLESRLRTRMRSALVSEILALELLQGWGGRQISLRASAVGNILTAPFTGTKGSWAAVEAHLASKLHGLQGTVHIPPALMPVAIDDSYIVEQPDGQYRTVTGHKVIADAGYTGGANQNPPGNAVVTGDYWVYVSGEVYWDVSDDFFIGESNQESIDMTRNLVERFNEAVGIVLFDPCAVAAILVSP